MSLIIRLERYAAPPQFCFFRGMSARFGETLSGLPGWSNVEKPWFSISAVEDGYWLRAETLTLRWSGSSTQALDDRLLRGMTTLTVGDCHILFFVTSGASEVLARPYGYDPLTEPNLAARIHLQIAGLGRFVPLFSQHSVTLGSADGCGCYLDLPGISAQHCKFQARADSVAVEALDGAISHLGQERAQIELQDTAVICLEPLGLPIRVEMATS